MKLVNDSNWKSVHFNDRTILKSDKQLFPKDKWQHLLNDVEVEPMKDKGQYRAVSNF